MKKAKRKATILKENQSDKYSYTDQITLFVQFWFKFANSLHLHFKAQTVLFTLTFLHSLEISFDSLRILSMLILLVIGNC